MKKQVILNVGITRVFASNIKKMTILLGLCLFVMSSLNAQNVSVTGTVTDDTGAPLPGVFVVEKNTNNGVNTDFDGNYSIALKSKGILVFSYVGMTSQEIAVNGKENINVSMEASSDILDEVVVIGYGSQSRSTITSSVVKVDADETRASSNGNALVALQGKVAGMEVRVTSGQPGASPSIVIRGGSSTSVNDDGPLYVIDGVVRSNMNDFNPEDIKTFQVLKDAASASIYGARAANGVVLITTKTGKISENSYGKINLKYSVTLDSQASKYPWSTARDYLWASRTAANQGYDTTGSIGRNNTPSYSYGTGAANYSGRQGTGYGNSVSTTEFLNTLVAVNGQSYVDDLLNNKGYETMVDPVTGETLIFKDNNYQEVMFQDAMTSDFNLSFEGGNNKGSFFTSLGLIDQEGILYKTNYKRYNFNLNGSYKIKDNITVNAAVSYSNRLNNSDQNSDTDRSSRLPQTVRMYRDNGTPSIGEGGGSPRNILNTREYRWNNNENWRYTLRFGLDWEILKDLHFKPSGSIYKTENIFKQFERTNPYRSDRYTYNSHNASTQNSLDLLFSYNKSIAEKHNFDLVAGFNMTDSHNFSLWGSGKNAATDNITTLNASATDDERTSSGVSNSAIVSWLSRLNYNYEGKYLVTLSYRIDGSSVFSENNRYAKFPSVSGGWNLHKEDFWMNSKLNDYVSSFKLRASWGKAGSDKIALSDTQGNYGTGYNYAGGTGVLGTKLANSDLVWETTSSLDIGFDMGIANNRHTVFLDWYDKRTSDRLTGLPLVAQSGFGSIISNVGTLQNKGIEIGIESKLIEKENFSWRLGATFSKNISKIVELPGNGVEKNRIGGFENWNSKTNAYEIVAGTAEGQRLGEFWVYQLEGIYQTDAEAALAPTDTQVSGSKRGVAKQAGDAKWLDKDGNGIIDGRDRVFAGYRTPDRSGSFINTIAYKDFTFRSVITYALGHQVYNNWRARANANARNRVATTSDVTNGNIWWGPGFEPYEGYDATKAIYPRYSAASDWDNGYRNHLRDNTAYLSKGDYVSFSEVSLSYSLPELLTKKLKVGGIDLSVAAYNLGYITEFDGLKPDQYDGRENGDYPNPFRVSFTTKITF